jgi:glycosyltransferase involved in cell wall biosynthesis
MGPIKVVYELTQEYLKEGHEVVIYYFDETKNIDFPCKTLKISLFKKNDFKEFDIVHTHGIRPDFYVFLHKNNVSKTHFVTTLHNYVKKDLYYQYNFFISIIFSYLWNIFTLRHDAIVVLSEDAKTYYLDFWLNKNIHVINNGINCKSSHINNYLPERKEEITLGAIGMLTKRKGIDQILSVLQKNNRYFLYILGDGKEKNNLEKIASNLNVSAQVKFLGYKDNAIEYLHEFDIFLMPSRSEGFPIALLEAAKMKKAIVCSDINIHKEVFDKNEVSFFELENIVSLDNAIQVAFKNKATFEDNVYKKFISSYTSGSMAKQYIALYRNLINE